VKIAADTNLMLRMLLNDDPRQSRAATIAVNDAALVVVTLPTLCEIAWVLRSRYRLSRSEIARFMKVVIGIEKIVVDTAAVQAGLATLDAGGDFADGVIAHEGRRLGAEVFVTFDKSAAVLLERSGFKSLALA